ncbi:lecithin retinol acyltransferase family protein [Sandaracinus amylolyticus]|uniref:lecithin retinol acyltransferase family protein n=1 Tax=Sandaracinus amylolyticus TaxID=927083 RepID=UPI001F3A5C38|nr:lecithin retinol acyltransferase family protein [Sandaracinus amylolyticus]
MTDRNGPDGWPQVVHKSKRRGVVAEESWSEFAAGRPVHVIGYLGTASPDVVIARARARIGERWSPLRNCQHFVRACHAVVECSPDLDRAWRPVVPMMLALTAYGAFRLVASGGA